MRLGVIGGTGLYDWGPGGEEIGIETEYGPVAASLQGVGRHEVLFVPRHGPAHEAPPHRVNHRANVRALAAAKVDAALGVFNVGALDPNLRVGSWVLPQDFIEVTGTVHTFFDDAAVHVDATEPYCASLRDALSAKAPKPVATAGIYASVGGPRFETAVEARTLRQQGATIVGMTGGPEATLMREAGLHYAALAFVGNVGGASATAQDVQVRLARAAPGLRAWVGKSLGALSGRWSCRCTVRGAAMALVGRRSR